MSGTFQHRVNRSWGKTFANISSAVFFWEWLKFFEAHSGMIFVGYGTGKTAFGTEPPLSWKNWDPTAVGTPPMADNSWFVVEAENADPLLDGGGTQPWQMKVQFSNTTPYDDCNVADIDYGYEGLTDGRVVIRLSAMGGWSNTSLDFAPTGGEEASTSRGLWYGLDENFYLDIVGDDDTIFYKGAGYDTTEYLEQSVGGYIGMLRRRSSSITYPFYAAVGNIGDVGNTSNVNYAKNGRNAGSVYAYQWPSEGYWNEGGKWPSYSLWSDGTQVNTHHHDTWDFDSLPDVTWDPANSADIVPAMLVAQKQAPDKHAVIGEYRLIGATFTRYAQHVVFGTDSEWIEICYQSTTYGGIAMRWPSGVVPIW